MDGNVSLPGFQEAAMFSTIRFLSILVFIAAPALSLTEKTYADSLVYSSTANQTGSYLIINPSSAGQLQAGDEITLGGDAKSRVVTNFSIGYNPFGVAPGGI